MAALFTAFDTTSLLTSITAIASVGVSTTLVYLAWKHIKKGSNRI